MNVSYSIGGCVGVGFCEWFMVLVCNLKFVVGWGVLFVVSSVGNCFKHIAEIEQIP